MTPGLNLFRGPRKYLLLSALVIVGVSLVLYRPVLDAGFWSDDYHVISPAARFSWQDFLTYYVDPRVQWIWYRPMQGIGVGIQYALYGGDPRGYHAVQLLLHCANALLLFGLVAHLTRKWRTGLVAALIYVTWSVISLAVYWPTVADPLLALFCLLALAFWIRYLELGSWLNAVLAYVALIGGLGTKENAAAMPIVFFLADRWLVGKPASPAQLFRRYVPFVFVLLVYAAVQYGVVLSSAYTRDSGYGIGFHILPVALAYLRLLAFPWQVDSPLTLVWLALIACLLVYLAIKRRWQVLFLAATALLTLAPVMLFRGTIARYLYLSLMATAAGGALLLEAGVAELQRRIKPGMLVTLAAVGAVMLLVMSGSATIADGAEGYTGFVRQTNLQLRPIFQTHRTFAPDTYLYFVDQPFPTGNLVGALALRYGANVIVNGLDQKTDADLRTHKSEILFYYDEQHNLREQTVAASASVSTTPALPVRFEQGLSLNRIEVSSNQVKRGDAIVLFLYWSAAKRIDQDYSVFAHLIDPTGKMVAGYDSQPARGTRPTSAWTPQQTTLDALVLPVDSDAPIGQDYRLEVGMYDPATMRRLSRLDAAGQPQGDTIVFEPFEIVP